jgi:Spy/CpxP family protein refolding chaperone
MVAALVLVAGSAAGQSPSPYAGLEERPIKALSPEDVAAYEAGAGMGLALAAELNGYPGPMHVLELASQLQLDAEQQEATTQALDEMKAAAVELGRRIVELESRLDAAFAGGEITEDELESLVSEIAELQGRLRLAHLAAHLRMVEILTPNQVVLYGSLRGYQGEGTDHRPHRHHDPAHHDPAHHDPAHHDPAHHDPAHHDPPHHDPAHHDPAHHGKH